MTQSESDKNAYFAFKKLCEENKNTETMSQLRIMVASMGAERAHVLAMSNSGLPKDVKAIMYGVLKHIETENITN